MRKALAAAVLVAALAASGCATSRRARVSDEFLVARNAPLVIPPDFNLAPPVAGTQALDRVCGRLW